MMTTVNYSELRNAFEFVSSGSTGIHCAYIHIDTGAIYWTSTEIDLEETTPDDIEDSEHYITVPHKNELKLGQSMALAFIDQALPNDYNTVASYFRRRGAYRRFKELLQSHGLLEKWYVFEEQASDAALLKWCEENNIQILTLP